MQDLLELLKDGNSRTLEMMAKDLGTTTGDVIRRMEYLEHIGAIRQVAFMDNSGCGSCSGCTGCSGESQAACRGCVPQNADVNMGKVWEVA